MKKIRTILIDDEPDALDTLEIELNAYCPQVEIVAKCPGAKEGIEAIKAHNPELLFLDIQMPWMNGFEMLQSLGNFSFDVIFVTAYNQFAIKAFEVNAVDYLLKPVSKEKLINAVEKANQRHPVTEEVLSSILETIQAAQSPAPKIPHLALPTPEGLEFVKIDNILYASAESNYTKIYLSDGRSIMLAKTLSQMEEVIKDQLFLRIHQSYIVNLNYIKKYVRGQGGKLVLENGDILPVSRSHKTKLMSLLR